MKRCFLLFLTLISVSLPCMAGWMPALQNYIRKDYAAGSQNWQIAQGANRWMYFANKDGVLEYNGMEWRLIPLDGSAMARALYCDDTGRIYAGGVNEIGYLEADACGRMRYHNLTGLAETAENNFGNVWCIRKADDMIFFFCDRMILKYRPGDPSITAIAANGLKINGASVIDNTLYVYTNTGVRVLAGDHLYRLDYLQRLDKYIIRNLLPFQGKILIVTYFNGLWIADAEQREQVRRFETEADPFLLNNNVFTAATDGMSIAVGTVLHGIVLLDGKGRATGYINDSYGLIDDTILALGFDRAGNLWAGLDNGICRIAIGSPLQNLYSVRTKYYGSVYDAGVFNGRLWLATNRGLCTTEWPVKISERPTDIAVVPGMTGQIWSLDTLRSELVCSSDHGLWFVRRDGTTYGYDMDGVWKVRKTRTDPGRLWAFCYGGIYTSRLGAGPDGRTRWLRPEKVAGTAISTHKFSEVVPGKLLALPGRDLPELFDISSDFSRALSHRVLDRPDIRGIGLPGFPGGTLAGEDGFYVCGADGSLTADTALNALYDLHDRTNPYVYVSRGQNGCWGLGAYMICRRDSLGLIKQGHDLPVIRGFEKLVPLSDSSALVLHENGCTLWNVLRSQHRTRMRMQFTDLRTANDSLLWSNTGDTASAPQIGYAYRSLKIRWCSDDFIARHGVRYRCRTDDEAWSPWTVRQEYALENTPMGAHRFEVESVSANGDKNSAVLHFTILKPRWASAWAWPGYLLLTVLGIGVVRYWDDRRIHRRERRIQRAEQGKMQEREASYIAEAERREQEITRLKNEQLELEVRHKDQELAATAINLARKNEILTRLKNDAGRLAESIKTDGTSLNIRLRVLHLRDEIENNITQDDALHKFEEHFDLVHNNFMHRLYEQFPDLTAGERRMCAYVKMHLSTKEIAPLMNLSVRGVETLRYRLRKKFGLHREASLTNFLTNF